MLTSRRLRRNKSLFQELKMKTPIGYAGWGFLMSSTMFTAAICYSVIYPKLPILRKSFIEYLLVNFFQNFINGFVLDRSERLFAGEIEEEGEVLLPPVIDFVEKIFVLNGYHDGEPVEPGEGSGFVAGGCCFGGDPKVNEGAGHLDVGGIVSDDEPGFVPDFIPQAFRNVNVQRRRSTDGIVHKKWNVGFFYPFWYGYSLERVTGG